MIYQFEMQKLHLFLKDTEVKKKKFQATKRTALVFISFFLFPKVFQACIPLPPHLDFMANSYQSVRRSGFYSLLHYKHLLSLRMWWYILHGKAPSTLTLPRPLTASYSKGFIFFQCPASSYHCVSSPNLNHVDELSLCCSTFWIYNVTRILLPTRRWRTRKLDQDWLD